jgi:predicted extracellular nuclease
VTVDYQYSSFFLSNSADEVILLDGNLAEVDRVEYDGGPNFPDPTGASMALRNPSFDNNVGANWCTSATPFGDGDQGTPGAANDCILFIHEIQGSGPTVAISGPVVVEAIVTSLLEEDDVLDGFLLQEEDADADADLLTSEGIRVDCGATCLVGVTVGDLVTVAGTAGETFGMSEINANSGSVMIGSSGNTLPTASQLSLPAPAGTDEELTFEPLEGMLVEFVDELFVSEYFELARFGQVVLTVDQRPFQFTHTNAPSVAGYTAFLEDLAKRRIVFDDDNNDQNDPTSGPTADTPYYWERPGFSTTNFFRGGDSITGLTGGLDWAFGEWRVKAALGAFDYSFTPNEARTAVPDAVGGTLEVASFNVLNYFTTIDTGAPICGPSGTLGCRGASSSVELDRQREKIVTALAAMDADVVGLVELENNVSDSLSDLVDGLNDVVGSGTYEYLDTGTIGSDAIKVGLIYKPDAVAPVGSFAILDSSVDPDFIDTKNRPVLIQTFEEIASAARVTVAVNHLKSKGSGCDDVGDPNANDGQGNCNQTRTSAVEALVDYLATDPTGSGDDDFLIMGDLNAYAMEDPIAAATAAGYTDLIETFKGVQAYSFVFDGQLGYLDHALGNASLLGQVTDVTEWHINSDEVNVLDYNDGIQDPGEASFERKSNALPVYEGNAYRSSDHDPLVIGLALDTPRSLKQQVLEGLEALPPPEDHTTDKQIGKAIDSVEESLDPDSWESGSTINTKKVFDQERRAVVQLMLVAASDVPEAAAALAAIDALVDADRQLAQVELYAAIARGGSASKIASAQAAMAEATALIGAGIYNEAINAYKAAWDAATKA